MKLYLASSTGIVRDLGELLVAIAAHEVPCPVRSRVTDQPCLLPEGHPMWDATRFHRYSPPSAQVA